VILPSSVTDTHAPRVLLIDDDPVVRDSIQALLEYLGYQCGAAADGPSGLRLFEGEPWDLVLTDLTLPGMTGWQIVDAVRKRVPRLPVIVMSGADHLSVRTAAAQCRVSVLFKPFGLDALQGIVVSALHASAPPSPASGDLPTPSG
jgi:CheY-like chemotaxis protein